jgi:hypothetical protein
MQTTNQGRRAFLYGIGLGAASLVSGRPGAAAPPADSRVAEALGLRKEELRRRVASLPAELARWQVKARTQLDMNIHSSQLEALNILVGAFTKDQQGRVDGLVPGGNPDQFLRGALDLVVETIRAQSVWDFYRGKLQLRFSPEFKASLRVADVVAWDCYRPPLEKATYLDIIPAAHLREPPLCYYEATFSPATWVREDASTDLRDRRDATVLTPIPVIGLPWDHAENLWEFLSLPHEVGHDLEADLKLRPALLQSLEATLHGKVPGERISVWKAWLAETFADLVALQLVGPAFVDMLMHLLLLPPHHVNTFRPDDPHPTPYVRILMGTAYIRGLIREEAAADARQRAALSKDADRIDEVWRALYGAPPQFQNYLADCPLVSRSLMDTPLAALKGNTVRSLIPYSAADDLRIRDAAEYLRTGRNRPGRLQPRHCLAAARLAVSGPGQVAGSPPAALQDINDRTARLVNDNAPEGLLRGKLEAHRDFIAGFSKTIPVEPARRRIP